MFVPPRLAPPVPKFPTQFKEDDEESFALVTSKTVGGWPSEEITSGDPSADWHLRTDREQYIAYLERKLRSLATNEIAHNGDGSQRMTDSGYHGSTSSAESLNSVPAYHDVSALGSEFGSEHGEDASYGNLQDGMTKEEEAREEGEALLPSRNDQGSVEHSLSDGETASPVEHRAKVKIMPPTPTTSSNEDRAKCGHSAIQPQYQPQPQMAEETLLPRKISFSTSVRISGGIRSKPRVQRHLPDLFSPRLSPTTDDGIVDLNIGREPLPPNFKPRSRSGSPGASGFSSTGRGEDNGGARRGSSGSLFPTSHSGYSSASGSRLPSRSSSPCSSIYAPLQPPSETCPSPLMVRPPPKRGSGINFREYLRGREGQDEEEIVKGYRDLVEDQRKKKARIETKRIAIEKKARRESLGIWNSMMEMFISGAANSGGWRGGLRGANNGLVYGSTGSSPRKDQSMVAGERDRRPTIGDHRPVVRKPSQLSLSSVPPIDEEAPATSPPKRSPSSMEGQALSQSEAPKFKTAADVMFGASPRRWFTIDWWLWKIRNLLRSMVLLRRYFSRVERENSEEDPILGGRSQRA